MDTLNVSHLAPFLTSLAIGLLIGVEREQAGSSFGLRTTALAALFGSLAALIGQSTGSTLFLPAALLCVAGIAIYKPNGDDRTKSINGPTTRFATVLSFALGVIVWLGHARYAVSVAIVCAALLHFKSELHGLSARILPGDFTSIIQFSALSFIVLPVLPNVGYGPYLAFNPHHVWLMVVLISGLSLAGYLAMRIAGERLGPVLLGVLGGLVSSTATTLVYARRAQKEPTLMPLSAFVILVANLIVPLRLGLIALSVAPALISTLWPVLLGNLAVGGIGVYCWWRRLRSTGALALPEVANPTELGTALTFGAMYAVILLLATWLSDFAGTRGLYLASAVSGLTELDAIVLSTLNLFNSAKLDPVHAANAIGIALLSNLCFKTGLLAWVSGRELLARCQTGLVFIGAGILIGIWVVN